jgi:hypothetical protein
MTLIVLSNPPETKESSPVTGSSIQATSFTTDDPLSTSLLALTLSDRPSTEPSSSPIGLAAPCAPILILTLPCKSIILKTPSSEVTTTAVPSGSQECRGVPKSDCSAVVKRVESL